MSSLAPSKSTVYVSNIPFCLTNNDLHKVFSIHGQVVKVTIVKDKVTRQSKGVAFIQYLRRDDAMTCVNVLNGKRIFDRTIKCSIAKDNGRSTEFIRKRHYPDKSSCYECGEEGHLSYACPKNALGIRNPPPKKEKKAKNDKKKFVPASADQDEEDYSDGQTEDEEPDLETLSAAIQLEQARVENDEKIQDSGPVAKKKIVKKNSYFSDEEDISD